MIVRTGHRLLAAAGACAVSVAVLPGVGPAAAQTTVTTEAEFRAAFGDKEETEIVLGADIGLTCPGAAERIEGRDLLIRGQGHTITQHCAGERALAWGANSTPTLTLENVTFDASGPSRGGVSSNGPVAAVNSTFVGNQSSQGGAAIASSREVVVNNSVFTRNKAESNGGAISATRGVTITDSTLSGNTSMGAGGAVQTRGDVSVESSVFSRNKAAGSGGALLSWELNDGSGGNIEISNSTLEGNEAELGAGAYSFESLSAMNSTVTGNRTVEPDGFADDIQTAGGGLLALNGEMNLIHTTVVGNSAEFGSNVVGRRGVVAFGSVIAKPEGGGSNCANQNAESTSQGFNFSDDDSCGFTRATDQIGDDPGLAESADNGGPTKTHLPEESSPLVDAITPAEEHCDPDVATDQRGVERPQGAGCDIGAVEVAGAAENQPPVAESVDVEATEGRPAAVAISASDPDGDELTYTVGDQAGHGTVSGDGPEFTYTSAAGFTGEDGFTVDVCDPDDACSVAAVKVRVKAFKPSAEPPADAGQLTVAPSTVTAGDDVTVSGSGFEPNEPVFLVLYSEPQRLAAVRADDGGAISATSTIPEDTAAGEHRLVAYGEEAALAAPLTVLAGEGMPKDPKGGGIPKGEGDPEGEGGPKGGPKGDLQVKRFVDTAPVSGGKKLAMTGLPVVALLGAGSALVALGGACLLAARRTRQR